jgi:putative addiction module component (TIGR02574 family)
MTETAEKLKTALCQLSSQERAEIASFLIHSLDEEVDPDAEAAWDIEIAARMQQIQKGTASGEPAESVFSRLKEKYL